jgi:hypothetical protein
VCQQCSRLVEERDEAERQLKHIKRGEFLLFFG